MGRAAIYSTTKFGMKIEYCVSLSYLLLSAVNGYSTATRRELRPYGVRVCCIEPGTLHLLLLLSSSFD